MSDYDLEDPGKLKDPQEEIFRVVYRRRGSDLILGAVKGNKLIQVTRWNHRFKKGKTYTHSPEDIAAHKEAIKKVIEDGKYKLVSGGPADGLPEPDDK